MVELNVVEQRYQAVLEVLNQAASVTDVARRSGVSRQTVHAWLRRYASGGLAGLADGSAKPLSCPHQMAPELEARIVELRRLNREGSAHDPVPSRRAAGGAVAGAVVDLSVFGASRVDRTGGSRA